MRLLWAYWVTLSAVGAVLMIGASLPAEVTALALAIAALAVLLGWIRSGFVRRLGAAWVSGLSVLGLLQEARSSRSIKWV